MNYYTYENRRIFFGPIAGIIESICMQPLDTLKVLKQSNQYTSFTVSVKHPKILYKGFTPFTSQMFVKYFLRFTAFETFKSKNDVILFSCSRGTSVPAPVPC